MANVVYDCMDCGEFWIKGPIDQCPKCSSHSVGFSNDEPETCDEWGMVDDELYDDAETL
jgi:uncharacterized Zn finger protein